MACLLALQDQVVVVCRDRTNVAIRAPGAPREHSRESAGSETALRSEENTRQRLSVSFGKVTWTVAERKLREHILATGVDSVETFNEVTGPLTTFREQADWWLKEIRAGRILSKKRRTPMKSATVAGYESAV